VGFGFAFRRAVCRRIVLGRNRRRNSSNIRRSLHFVLFVVRGGANFCVFSCVRHYSTPNALNTASSALL